MQHTHCDKSRESLLQDSVHPYLPQDRNRMQHGWRYHVNTEGVMGGVEMMLDAKGEKRGGKVFCVVAPNYLVDILHHTITMHVEQG